MNNSKPRYRLIIDEYYTSEFKIGDIIQQVIFDRLYLCQIVDISKEYCFMDVIIVKEIKERLYSLSEIKKAFWDTFKNIGEVYFWDIENEDDEDPGWKETDSRWEDFKENLDK